jgi:hypothetical protein
MEHAFTVRADKNALQHTVRVTLPDRMADLPEQVQASLYRAAIASETISVQTGLRGWLAKHQTASVKDVNAEAQARFDARLKGIRRASTTVVIERVVKVRTKVDATALKLTGPQIAHFAADPDCELVNVPDNMKKYLPET